MKQLMLSVFALLALASQAQNTTVVAEGDLRLVPHRLARATDAVDAGGWHSLALDAAGEAVGWGRNDDGQATMPAFDAPVVQLAAGAFHSLALLADGSVTTWGDAPAVPSDLPPARWVAAGRGFSCAVLAADSSVVCWGADASGQTSPPPLTSVTEVHCGRDHAYALLADRSIVGWGSNAYNQLSEPPNLPPYIWQLRCGLHHTAAVAYNGQVWAWGSNTELETIVPPDLGFVRSAAAGLRFTAALSADTLRIWGRWPWPRPDYTPAERSRISHLEAGYEHLLVLFEDGSVDAWGDPTFGAAVTAVGVRGAEGVWPGLVHHSIDRAGDDWLRIGDRSTNQHLPQSNIVGPIDGGESFGVGLTADGTVRLWGSLAFALFQNRPTDAGYTALAAGRMHALAWKADGTLSGMGSNASGQTTSLPPTVLSAAAAGDGSALVLPDGSLELRGNHNWGAPPAGLPALTAVDASRQHLAALTASGELVAFGATCGAPCTDLPTGPFVAVHAADGITIGVRADSTIAVAAEPGFEGMQDWPAQIHELRTSPTAVMAIVPHNTAPYLLIDSLPMIDICLGASDSLDIQPAFADAEGDSLTLTLTGSTPDWAAATMRGGFLVLEGGAGEARGEATITIRATDPEGLYAETTIQLRERPALQWKPARISIAGDRSLESTITFPIGHPFPVTAKLAGEVPCLTYDMGNGLYGVKTPKIISGTYAFSALEDDLGCTSSTGHSEIMIPAVR